MKRNIEQPSGSGFNYGPIDPLSIFSFMYAIAMIFHFLSGPRDGGESFSPARPDLTATANEAQGLIQKLLVVIDPGMAVGIFALGFALLLVLNPRSITLLCLMAISQIVHYIVISPIGLNHYSMNTFVSVTVCVGALFFLKGKADPNRRIEFYNSFASSGRFFLVTMYFYGIFHKLTPGFLNPDLSCAVMLSEGMVARIGLEGAQWVKYAAIWGTFIMEGVAMMVLFSRRWKYWGFVIGIPFHLVVAFSGFRFFMEYSSAVVVLYFLFLPHEFYSNINSFTDKVRTILGLSIAQFWKRSRIAFCAAGILAGLYTAYVLMYGEKTSQGYTFGMMPIFAVYSLAVYGSVLYFSRNIDPAVKEPMYGFTKPWLAIFPILFFLNGFGPYLGWKTESAVAMFSHLHTEGSRSNHLLIGWLPQMFDYQKRLVKIISSPHPQMQHLADIDNQLVYFEFRRFVTLNPGVPVSYEIDGVRYEHDENNADNIQSVPWWQHKLILFKPVDNNWPKVCSH